ncbi:hypothetical protein AVEN_8245-1 [Araneus ventricosus]|uniref:Uncharacterized protein n=1 Tax=Araneus ventricosus TaxID=182803 RepID=A0A4Y2L0D8_ARAVE|nr:hypothetical protein AVEN_8245-1 [Araneus ventricosus]
MSAREHDAIENYRELRDEMHVEGWRDHNCRRVSRKSSDIRLPRHLFRVQRSSSRHQHQFPEIVKFLFSNGGEGQLRKAQCHRGRPKQFRKRRCTPLQLTLSVRSQCFMPDFCTTDAKSNPAARSFRMRTLALKQRSGFVYMSNRKALYPALIFQRDSLPTEGPDFCPYDISISGPTAPPTTEPTWEGSHRLWYSSAPALTLVLAGTYIQGHPRGQCPPTQAKGDPSA